MRRQLAATFAGAAPNGTTVDDNGAADGEGSAASSAASGQAAARAPPRDPRLFAPTWYSHQAHAVWRPSFVHLGAPNLPHWPESKQPMSALW